MGRYWPETLFFLFVTIKKFGDPRSKSGPLKNCAGPQFFDIKGPHDPWKCLLILTPGPKCWFHKLSRKFHPINEFSWPHLSFHTRLLTTLCLSGSPGLRSLSLDWSTEAKTSVILWLLWQMNFYNLHTECVNYVCHIGILLIKIP